MDVRGEFGYGRYFPYYEYQEYEQTEKSPPASRPAPKVTAPLTLDLYDWVDEGELFWKFIISLITLHDLILCLFAGWALAQFLCAFICAAAKSRRRAVVAPASQAQIQTLAPASSQSLETARAACVRLGLARDSDSNSSDSPRRRLLFPLDQESLKDETEEEVEAQQMLMLMPPPAIYTREAPERDSNFNLDFPPTHKSQIVYPI